MNNRPANKSPALYSDSQLLRFFFQDVSPNLNRAYVWPGLVVKGNRLEGAACSKCRRTDTYVYADGQHLTCSHLNSCGYSESILDQLSGDRRPSSQDLQAAVARAASLAGVPMPSTHASPEDVARAQAWTLRRSAMDATLAWCQASLWDGSKGATKALVYLVTRGFGEEQILDLGLGYWPDTAKLSTLLAEQNMLQAATDAALLHGNLAGYIIIPWRDEHGNLLTFYGRWPGNELPTRAEHPGRWKEEASPLIPKTFALPGEDSKASPLYMDRLLRAKNKEVVLVEGVFDAALAQSMGDSRVVAYVAASPSGKQVELLARLKLDSITICPDPDEGGDRGLLSSIARITEAGMRLYVAPRLPDGKDPDEYILSAGIDAWKAHVARAVPSSVVLADKLLATADTTSGVKAKDDVLKQVSALIAGLPAKDAASVSDREQIIKLTCAKLGVTRAAVAGAAKTQKPAKPQPAKPPEPAQHPAEDSDWIDRLVMLTNKSGSYPAKNLANAATVFAYHPAWRGTMGYCTFTNRLVAVKCPPSHKGNGAPREFPYIWEDHDDSLAAIWLQKLKAIELDIKREIVAEALDTVGRHNKVHPIRDYLQALVWDKTARLDTWLQVYLGASTEDAGAAYLKATGSKWMISAVSRIMTPGSKVDSMLILEGRQDLGKSTALRVLAGGERYFLDELHGFAGKDAEEALEGKWIVEIAELAASARASVEEIKGFVSRTDSNNRRAYARRKEHWSRQCVFAATTNDSSYLKDTTGNRRFWPVKCEAIDLDKLKQDRDQLWAEAVVRFQAGEPWHLDKAADRETARDVQESRFQSHAWEQTIHDYVAIREFVSVQQILECALSLTKDKWDQRAQNTVAACLKRLGWCKFQRKLKPGEQGEYRVTGGTSGIVWLYRRIQADRVPGQEG